MVVPVCGDSNALQGKYGTGVDVAGSGIFQYKHDGTIVAANEAIDNTGINLTDVEVDGSNRIAVGSTVALCRLLRDRGHVPAGYSILIVPAAWAGTAFLNYWATTGSRFALDGGGGLTNGFYTQVNGAMASHAQNRLWFFDWNHGANDGGQTQAQYQNNMIATWGEIRSTISGASNTAIIAPGIPHNRVDPALGAQTNLDGVIAAQRNIGSILSNAAYVDCEDITAIDSSNSHIHYPAAAHRGGTNNAPGNVGEVVTNPISERKYAALLRLGVITTVGTNGVWRQVKIGGGGYVTGIDKSTDETTIVCRNDTYGAHVWNSAVGVWEELITSGSMPSAFTSLAPDGTAGVFEIRVAPSQPSRLYMMTNGSTYRSDNRGRTWVDVNMSYDVAGSELARGVTRFMGQKMAVDPINPDVVYLGTPSSGVYFTTNAGRTWTQISTGTIPACSTTFGGVNPGHPGICFDPTSGSTNGRTNTIYIPVYGSGVYRSTNAGSTWASISSPLPKVRHAKVDQSGNYWAAGLNSDDSQSQLYKYSGSWSAQLSPATYADAVDSMVIDSANANRVIIFGSKGEPTLSTNGGTSFGSAIPFTRTSSAIPWLAYTDERYMAMGDVIFVGSNEIWIAHGIGVAKCTFSGSPSSIVWDYITKGIENLTANDVVCPPSPNGKLFTAAWDRAIHIITDPETYPSFHYPDNQFRMAWNCDYATSDPNFVAHCSAWGSVTDSKFGFYTANAGSTWAAFPTTPGSTGTIPLQSGGQWTIIGGAIACASPTNIIIVPAGNNMPWYTKDGGTTWTEIVISGVPTSGETGFGWAYYNNFRCVCADRVNPNTFYLYNYLTGTNVNTAKLYRSTNSGDSWTAIGDNIPNASSFASIKAVPGNAGHLFFNGGGAGGANPGDTRLMRSIDSGATWAEISGYTIREPHALGFGKAAPGQSYPSIAFAGWLNGVYGVWRSDDNCISWSSMGTFPAGWLNRFISLEGSKEVYGTWYGAVGGLSYLYRTEAMQYTKL